VHIIIFFIFTQQRSAGLDGILFPALRQYLSVVCHPKGAFITYTIIHDFAARPHAIFSTWQGTQRPDTKPTLPRAKNATAQPTTPANIYRR